MWVLPSFSGFPRIILLDKRLSNHFFVYLPAQESSSRPNIVAKSSIFQCSKKSLLLSAKMLGRERDKCTSSGLDLVIWNASRKFQQIEYVTARRNGHETLRSVHHPNIPELDKTHHFSFSSCSVPSYN